MTFVRSRPHRTGTLRRGAKTTLVALCAIFSLTLLTVSASPTSAQWADTENTSVSLAGLQVPAPVYIPQCSYTGTQISVNWEIPEGYPMLGSQNLVIFTSGGALLSLGSLLGSSTVVTSPYPQGSAPSNRFVTDITLNMADFLLGNLLSFNQDVSFYLAASPNPTNNWDAAWKSAPFTVNASSGLAGINKQCVKKS